MTNSQQNKADAQTEEARSTIITNNKYKTDTNNNTNQLYKTRNLNTPDNCMLSAAHTFPSDDYDVVMHRW